MDIEKGLMLLLWFVVALTIIGFVVIIIIGYSTNFNFIFSLQDVTEISKSLLTSNSSLLG